MKGSGSSEVQAHVGEGVISRPGWDCWGELAPTWAGWGGSHWVWL